MKLVLNVRSAGWILLGMLIVILAVYVWPTVWMQPNMGVAAGDQVLPISTRVHRFNGKVQYLTLGGWESPTAAPAPPPAAVPIPPAPAPMPE